MLDIKLEQKIVIDGETVGSVLLEGRTDDPKEYLRKNYNTKIVSMKVAGQWLKIVDGYIVGRIDGRVYERPDEKTLKYFWETQEAGRNFNVGNFVAI